MKKIFKFGVTFVTISLLFLSVLVLQSCEERGTLKESQATQNQPMVIGNDTVDLYIYWPNKLDNIWVAKVRNQPTISLTYPQGKTRETVIILDNYNGKPNRIIKGDILSENDSIVVIVKKK